MKAIAIDAGSTSLSKDAADGSVTQLLPSTGRSLNPQLFGRQGESVPYRTGEVSRKRKRSSQSGYESDEVPRELDFFNPKVPNEVHGKHEASPVAQEATATREHKSTFISEEECKAILKAHKIKVTALSDLQGYTANRSSTSNTSLSPVKHERKKNASKVEKSLSRRKLASRLYPQPLMTFTQLATGYGVSQKLVRAIEEQGFTVPTEVQLGSLPLLCGYQTKSSSQPNLLTIAPTGSGKTLAFLIHLLHSLQGQPAFEGLRPKNQSHDYMHWPRAVIVAPTKELASQIVNEGRKIVAGGKQRVTLMRKGMKIWPQPTARHTFTSSNLSDDNESSEDNSSEQSIDNRSSANGKTQDTEWEPFSVQPEILISTPLTLLSSLKAKDGIIGSLSKVENLVLDEADVLLDPLFRQQTFDIWNEASNPGLQISLWSATMGSNIEELTQSIVKKKWELSKDTSQSIQRPLLRLVVGLKDTALPTISQRLIYAATEQGKLMALRQMIRPTAPTTNASKSPHDMNAVLPALTPPLLIFTQTIPRAQSLHSELLYDIPLSAGGSSRVACLHASLPTKARSAILTRFRKGEIWMLITTDLLARGMDFQGVNAVVNYDVPNSSAAYVHRVGRTGRAGREGGIAVTLYTREDIMVVKNVANVMQASERLQRESGGVESGKNGIAEWLLKGLPDVSKSEKKRLKKRGMEARREGIDRNGAGKRAKARMRIDTKSGFDRREENKKRGALQQKKMQRARSEDNGESEDDFGGFDD
ncbi:MAG: RNA-dependent ATPase rok1 [Bogoriella megaspora]|nr:MAG: RNA-dependent ATPase rok1 [Bogoriella megaspora]